MWEYIASLYMYMLWPDLKSMTRFKMCRPNLKWASLLSLSTVVLNSRD